MSPYCIPLQASKTVWPVTFIRDSIWPDIVYNCTLFRENYKIVHLLHFVPVIANFPYVVWQRTHSSVAVETFPLTVSAKQQSMFCFCFLFASTVFSPPGTNHNATSGLMFYARFSCFLRYCLCHSTAGGRITMRIVALTQSIKITIYHG